MAQHFGIARNSAGDALPLATVTVYELSTTTKVTIYSDAALTTSTANPVVADTKGRFSFYALPALYTLSVATSQGTVVESVDVRVGLVEENWEFLSTSADKNLKFRDSSVDVDPVTIQDGAAAETLVVDADGNIGVGDNDQFGGGEGTIFLKDAAVDPSAAVPGGGALYSTSGDPKWINTAGTVEDLTPGSGGLYYQIYHPDKKPSSGLFAGASDEFIGGEGISWRRVTYGLNHVDHVDNFTWDTYQNSNSGTVGAGSGESWGTAFATAPTGQDFSISAKITIRIHEFQNSSVGIGILMDGTEASPKDMRYTGLRNNRPLLEVRHHDYADADQSDPWSHFINATMITNWGTIKIPSFPASDWKTPNVPLYFWMGWNNSGTTITRAFSFNGLEWLLEHTTAALSTVPISVFMYTWNRFNASPCVGRFHWFRCITGAEALTKKVGN